AVIVGADAVHPVEHTRFEMVSASQTTIPATDGIIDHIDGALRLDPGKLAASRTVLRDYGNMLGATLIFVLDEQRMRMEEDGERGEWGVMMGFGPGFTVETMVLHAVASNLHRKN
uniref:Chalcone/stilbene synthase C-terminal domain-containing protein n=1 Tax=Aegilops tauschii subsp. strangulata TaxID=200361 RepID=A0A453AE01_AEGTS